MRALPRNLEIAYTSYYSFSAFLLLGSREASFNFSPPDGPSEEGARQANSGNAWVAWNLEKRGGRRGGVVDCRLYPLRFAPDPGPTYIAIALRVPLSTLPHHHGDCGLALRAKFVMDWYVSLACESSVRSSNIFASTSCSVIWVLASSASNFSTLKCTRWCSFGTDLSISRVWK